MTTSRNSDIQPDSRYNSRYNSSYNSRYNISYTIVPAKKLTESVWLRYWVDLNQPHQPKSLTTRLQERFYDIPNVNPFTLPPTQPNERYGVVLKTPKRVFLAGEFSLTDYRAKTCQFHFSIHPDVPTFTALHTARCVLRDIFTQFNNPDGLPAIKSLIGLTPTPNRHAIAFLKRLGFKPLGSVPYAAFYYPFVQEVPVLVSYITLDLVRSS